MTGQYGVKDLYVGVPVVIGAGGIERIVEISLNPEEKAAFDQSCASVKTLVDIAKQMRQMLRCRGIIVRVASLSRISEYLTVSPLPFPRAGDAGHLPG